MVAYVCPVTVPNAGGQSTKVTVWVGLELTVGAVDTVGDSDGDELTVGAVDTVGDSDGWGDLVGLELTVGTPDGSVDGE